MSGAVDYECAAAIERNGEAAVRAARMVVADSGWPVALLLDEAIQISYRLDADGMARPIESFSECRDQVLAIFPHARRLTINYDAEAWYLRVVRLLALVVALLTPGAARANAGPWSSPGWRGSCPDTRAAVISSVCSLVERDPRTCRIVSADCRDTYAGERSRQDGRAWQVDHGFPASVAWKRRTWRGADGKVCARPTGCSSFVEFYNDEGNLYVTTARSNNRKNDRMPDAWCPALRGARMLMARRIAETASKYKLRMTRSERSALALWHRGECAPGALLIGGE